MNDLKLFTIPNLLTCCNLLCGVLGIIAVFEGNMAMASWLIVAAAVFDFLDGFLARLLKQSSPIGKELDSLADVVTFGVLPAIIIFHLIRFGTSVLSFLKQSSNDTWLAYVALGLLVACSALRLAKFNIDTRQSDSFIGVPTPANGLLVASLSLIVKHQPDWGGVVTNPYVLFGYAVVMAYLLISEIPLLAFKFKTFGWQGNQVRYIFLAMAVFLLIFLKFAAIPLIIGLYVLLSLFKLK